MVGETEETVMPSNRVIGVDIRKINDFGIGTYIRNLLDGFAFSGTLPDVVFRMYTDDCYQPDALKLSPKRFPVVMIPSGRRMPLQGALPGASDLSAYHAPHYLTPDPGRLPFVLTVHDCIHLSPPPFPKSFDRLGNPSDQMFDAAKRLYHKGQGLLRFKKLVSRADALITVSDATSRDLLRLTRADPSRITRIYNCINEIYFSDYSESDTREFCRKFNLPFKDYVLYCGNDLYHKNLAGLLNAWKHLTVSMDTPLLVLAGPPRQFMIREYAEALGLGEKIVLLNRIPARRMPYLYRGARALVMPSLAEGFGLPIVEALASGIPVACSDIDVFHEISNDQARFFDPRRPLAIAETIGELLRDESLRHMLTREGPAQARKFSRENFVSSHSDVYNFVLEVSK